MYTRIFELPVTLNTKDIIIDVETTGTNFHRDEMTTVGWIKEGEMVIAVREGEGDKFDLDGLSKEWSGYRKWAWNCNFEKGFLKMDFNELKRDFNIFKPFRDILSVHPKLSNDTHASKELPELWYKFIETKNRDYVEAIIAHNRNCLLKELNVYLYLQVH